MGLDAHFEVVRLARELQAPADGLEGLAALPPDELRRLRRMVGDALHEEHRAAFERAAAASGLLPVALTAKLARTLVGAYLCARIAAEMPPERSVRLAGHLDVDFLADVCLSLDPVRVADTVAGLPDDRVVAVGMALLSRGEYVTLGRFVGIVRTSVVDTMAGRIHDPTALLHIAMAIEARDRLDEVVTLVDDDRLAALVRVARDEGEMAGALALMSHLGAENRRRLAALALSVGDDVVDAVVATAHAEDAWPDVLDLLASVGADDLARVAAAPATHAPEALRTAVEAADAADRWDALVPLVVHLDHEQLDALASMDDVLTPGRVTRLVRATMPRQRLWEPLVGAIARIPEERQQDLAARLAADHTFDVDGLLGLVRLVPTAADLPLVRALRRDGGQG